MGLFNYRSIFKLKEMKDILKSILAIIFNDAHIQAGNEDETYESIKYMVEYALKNNIKNLIFAGDLFHSRTMQRQDSLLLVDKILNLFHVNGLTLYIFPGNHDKTVYESFNSFLDVYKHYPSVEFNRELKNIVIDDVSIDLLPFFSDNMLIPMLEEAEGADILISHFAMEGSTHLGHKVEKTAINKKLLSKWKKVYLGHYHNHHEISKDIVHLPSLRQDGFGEDNNKGFSLLYSDGSYEIIKGKFKEYIKFSIDLDKTSNKEISKIIKANKGSEDTIRVEFSGTEAQCKSIDKVQFKGTGIQVKFKQSEIDESEISEPDVIIEKYSKGQIMDSFKDFCKDKDYSYSEGEEMIKEFLNK
jgi:exonuclease SbcD